MEEDKELWRWVVGYEGLYMVSDAGRVMSVPNVVVLSNGQNLSVQGRMLNPGTDNKGYKCVSLTKDRFAKTYHVHRLVAEAFIPKDDNLPHVNHIDEDKSNNSVGNLEWCDAAYNNRYGTRGERISRTTGKPVVMLHNGIVVRQYPSVSAAYRSTGISSGHISECCNGKRRSAGGHEWRYMEDDK